jgi:hypothetical protein
MRISVNLKSDEAKLITSFAQSNRMTRDKAVAHFLRAGLRNLPKTHIKNGLHVVSIPPGRKPTYITAERIREIEDEMDLEDVMRCLGKEPAESS